MKKLLLSIITSIIISAASFALPGFTTFIPDSAGEYVYYRDSSFTRVSYIGILGYDDANPIATIAIKKVDDNLAEGEYRLLTEEEIKNLLM